MNRYDNGVTVKEYASKGVAGAGLGLGIAGTAIGLLGNGLGGLLGYNNCGAMGAYHAQAFNEAHFESKEAAALRGENAELKAKIYADGVGTEVYKEAVRFAKENNDVINQKYVELAKALAEFDKRQAVQETEILCLKKDLEHKIELEAERRACGDNNLFSYVKSHYVQGTLRLTPSDICPPVMERYNSWEAPTASTETTTP